MYFAAKKSVIKLEAQSNTYGTQCPVEIPQRLGWTESVPVLERWFCLDAPGRHLTMVSSFVIITFQVLLEPARMS